MGIGTQLEIPDGQHEVKGRRRSTGSTPGKYCLCLNVDGRTGLLPFVTSKDVEPGTSVVIHDMELLDVRQ